MDQYMKMQEEPVGIDESDVVMYPMVTYNPETVELHPELKDQRPRRARERVLRYISLISISNIIVALICIITSSVAINMTASNYEPSLVVCVMVIFVTCLIWYLRFEGKKTSIQSEGVSKIFLYCFLATVSFTVIILIVAGVAMYILSHGELDECYEATNEIGNLEINNCLDEMGTRYFLALLTVTLLAAIGIISVVLLCFYFSVARKFSLRLGGNNEAGKVVVMERDEGGRKVIYRYNSETSDSVATDHARHERPDDVT
ncbi:uncharacterized protein LOC132721040 [Ruditapes philippinarum]|uniref:uncharacterized protein LOC132721040 n=1 Tax=Ruditapes philippinarum TaxID=129788 RepID=UPI00295A9AC0|nr:uncharacterized protein LOC132721040 [Ruditapes philippinarum]